MTYKMPKLTQKKKLCPRCGSPMMQKSETLKYCPVCHFSESSAKVAISVKVDLDEKKEELPKVEIMQVTKTGIVKEYSLESENSYVVIDRNSNTLWIWKGAASSPGDAYKAGVETTKLKSGLRMYSAKIKRVEQGEEPDNFPKLGAELKVAAEAAKAKAAEEQKLREAEEIKRKKEAEAKKQQEEAEIRRQEAEAKKQQEEAEREKAEAAQKAKEEEERKLKLEEERRQKEAEERKRMEAEEQKRKEIEERKAAQAMAESAKEDVGSVWNKLASDTKSTPVKEEVSSPSPVSATETKVVDEAELNEAISSLTLVRGITKEIATALYRANITTIMELSLGNAEEIAAKSGLESSVVSEIIGNAKDLLGFD